MLRCLFWCHFITTYYIHQSEAHYVVMIKSLAEINYTLMYVQHVSPRPTLMAAQSF